MLAFAWRDARAAILRHLERYADAELRLAAARIAETLRRHEQRVNAEPARDPALNLERQSRDDPVTARGTLRRAEAGHEYIDRSTAAAMIDRMLAAACPHAPATHHTSRDVTNGRAMTTCYECGVTWHADYSSRLRHVTSHRSCH